MTTEILIIYFLYLYTCVNIIKFALKLKQNELEKKINLLNSQKKYDEKIKKIGVIMDAESFPQKISKPKDVYTSVYESPNLPASFIIKYPLLD